MAAQLGVVYRSRAIGGAFVIQDARPAALPLSRVLTWVPARQSLTDALLAVRNDQIAEGDCAVARHYLKRLPDIISLNSAALILTFIFSGWPSFRWPRASRHRS